MKELKTLIVHRLVKSEDLNHHGTLFAGRIAEWFIESGFIAAANYVKPQHLVCLNLYGMEFLKPVRGGEIVCFSSKVVYAGRTSLITYIKVTKVEKAETVVDGFISFINVNEHTKPHAHKIVITPETKEDIRLNEEAKKLKRCV